MPRFVEDEKKEYNEDRIDSEGNTFREYTASVIMLAIKIYDKSNLSKTRSAKITIDRVVKISDNVEIVEKLIDGTDYECILRDVQNFKHIYRINVVGSNIKVLGIVRWY